MAKQPGDVLIVDDEEHIRKIMAIMLGKRGHRCRTAASGPEALELVGRESFDVVFTDLNMPGMDGLGLLARLRSLAPETMVIMVTAFASVDTAIRAMKEGAYDYIAKPFSDEEIGLVLEKALERGRLVDENRRLKREIGERRDASLFLGHSPAITKVFDIIAKVAETKATVLITGESGTGKELAARSIHQNGPRSERPFVAVNCGAVPRNLMESEFFGHVRGAFTGADKAKTGLVAEADGGTLFLDEVSELPLEMQVKLLRVLQEEEVRRVGENSPRKVDLRVVAATNKNLQMEVAHARFREDLYYRLNVITLRMPTLRERPEDIPELAAHFLAQAVVKNQLGPKRLSPAALRIMSAQTFGGNVRALKNVVEQAAIMSDGPVVGPGDLPFGLPIGGWPDDAGGVRSVRVSLPGTWTDLKHAIKSVNEIVERQMISRVLDAQGGNRSKAADILGLSRRSLITKISLYDIKDGDYSEDDDADADADADGQLDAGTAGGGDQAGHVSAADLSEFNLVKNEDRGQKLSSDFGALDHSGDGAPAVSGKSSSSGRVAADSAAAAVKASGSSDDDGSE
ncbi:MAG: sigma-54 dependent transcriptional regulator [Deltaproteobacteria bacterium]|jgi:two-component system response regulator AtoC|nr:sigma-54 dependent transcriptional regulator [Deltaproteobacteria bacterium]